VGSWWCWDWFEEKNAVRADNPQKNRTFEEKTALCGQTGIDCVGSRLVCDHAPEDAGMSVKMLSLGKSKSRYIAVKTH